MTRQPIDEISCCNCPSCQTYILKLVKRIMALEQWVEDQDEKFWEDYANHQYDGVDFETEEET